MVRTKRMFAYKINSIPSCGLKVAVLLLEDTSQMKCAWFPQSFPIKMLAIFFNGLGIEIMVAHRLFPCDFFMKESISFDILSP